MMRFAKWIKDPETGLIIKSAYLGSNNDIYPLDWPGSQVATSPIHVITL
jgi:hypothetical protein